MAILEFDLDPAVDAPLAGLVDGDPVLTLPGPGWSWSRPAANAYIEYHADPPRLSFDYARAFGGFTYLSPDVETPHLPGGPRVLHLVMAVLRAPDPGLVLQAEDFVVRTVRDGSRVRAQAGWWLSGSVQGTADSRPVPMGAVKVVTVVADVDHLRVLINGVEHESLPWGEVSLNPGYVSLRVTTGAWDLYRAQWWTGIPETLEGDIAALVAEYTTRHPIMGAATLEVSGSASLSDDDPWADVDIPDPEEPGGAVEPPELPEPVDPPDPDW